MPDLDIAIILRAFDRGASRTMNRVRGILNDTNRLQDLQQRNLVRRQELGNQAFGVAALAAAAIAPIKAAIDLEDKISDIAKVVDFQPGGLQKMERSILRLSRTLPLLPTELAEIAAEGGKANIAEKNLASFTEQVAQSAFAFEVLPQEAGSAFATLSNVLDVPITKLGSLADSINFLADNANTKAPKILDVLTRSGGVSTIFGLSPEQNVALAGTFTALGRPPEIAARAINSMLTTLQTARTLTPRAQRVLDAIGLSASDLERSIGQDAQGALLDFLRRIRELDNAKQATALSLLFGRGFSDDIIQLVQGLGEYERQLGIVSDRSRFAGSVQAEVERKMSNTANTIKLTSNAVVELASLAGGPLLSPLRSLLGMVKGLSNVISDFSQRFPRLSSVISNTLALVIGLRVASFALRFAWVQTLGPLLKLRIGYLGFLTALRNPAVIGRAVGALLKVGKVLSVLRFAVLGHPIIALVSLLATGAFLIIRNWERVSTFFTGFWSGLKNQVSDFTNFVPSFIKEPLGLGRPTLGPPVATGGAGGRSEVGGEVVVRFDNAPENMRVDEVRSTTPEFEIAAIRGLALGAL